MSDSIALRQATTADAHAIHQLIAGNLETGHLLPRSREELERHAHRFVVADHLGTVVGCAELAPLGETVAEVRSLVVEETYRGRRIGSELVHRLAADAHERGYATLCAFTHEPSHFVRLGFSIVPHVWVPEKIAHDCTSCAQFRRCGQYAVTLTLRSGASVRPLAPAAVIYGGRAAAQRKRSVERLRWQLVEVEREKTCTEPVPA